jgi:hypothetical protein
LKKIFHPPHPASWSSQEITTMNTWSCVLTSVFYVYASVSVVFFFFAQHESFYSTYYILPCNLQGFLFLNNISRKLSTWLLRKLPSSSGLERLYREALPPVSFRPLSFALCQSLRWNGLTEKLLICLEKQDLHMRTRCARFLPFILHINTLPPLDLLPGRRPTWTASSGCQFGSWMRCPSRRLERKGEGAPCLKAAVPGLCCFTVGGPCYSWDSALFL